MNSIDWGLLGQVAVVLIVVAWLAAGALFIAAVIADQMREWDHEEALEMDGELEHERYARQALLERQRNLLRIADDFASLPEHEQQRLQRLAEPLGFLDSFEDEPRIDPRRIA